MELHVNGKPREVKAQADESLLTVLRDELDLTGTKYGCGEAACGACTVLIDGSSARSCITPVGTMLGKRITTIEGLAAPGKLHKVQEAFLKEDVFQCAYCASGMIMSAAALLEKSPNPTQPQIIRALQDNICRCGTYPRILKAIESMAKT